MRSWLADHPVDLAVGAMVIAAFGYAFRLTGSSYFWADDLRLIRQGGSLGGLVDQYNGHLSVVILTVYRGLIEIAGFSYAPFRVVGFLILLSVPMAYYLTTKGRLTPPVAALVTLPLLWCSGVSLYPGEMNHQLAVLGAIGCAAALDRGPRADVVLAAALAFSLASAGGGVAVGAACLVHNLLTRAPLRRWAATVVPLALWAAWWLAVARDDRPDLGPAKPTVTQALRFAWDLGYEALSSVALGSGIVAGTLAVALLAYAGWTLRRGIRASANLAAWLAALAVWGVGLANSRAFLAGAFPFRYQLPAMAFLALAIVPRPSARLGARIPALVERRALAVAAIAILALGGARALAVRDDLRASARFLGQVGRVTRGETMMLGLGPGLILDDTQMALRFGWLRAGEVRELLDRYGQPFPTTVADADRRLVQLDVITIRGDGARDSKCDPTAELILYEPGPLPLYLSPGPETDTWTVEIRRLGDEWIRVSTRTNDGTVALGLPGLGVDKPWEVRAEGACRVGPRQPAP
jgi:hypothetical protein